LPTATLLWLAIIIFSVVGPVPINRSITVSRHGIFISFRPDWREQRQRWDRLNAIRVVLITLAFLALVISYRTL
jgi:hypothetical protein